MHGHVWIGYVCISSQLLAAEKDVAKTPYRLQCKSRSEHSPFREGGAPVQYVHIPKTGGTSVSNFLYMITEQQSQLAGSDLEGLLSRVWGLWNHHPVGWACFSSICSVPPVYIVTLRDPYSQLVSHYDYFATYQTQRLEHLAKDLASEFLRIQQFETEAINAGINQTRFLDHLILHHQHLLSPFGVFDARGYQSKYLVPVNYTGPSSRLQHFQAKEVLAPLERAPMNVTDFSTWFTCAVYSLLESDVVAVFPSILSDLIPQLAYHAPYIGMELLLRFTRTTASSDNKRSRPRQVLSPAARRVLKSQPGFRKDAPLHKIALRVAAVRSKNARECLQGSTECLTECQVLVTSEEHRLLENLAVDRCTVQWQSIPEYL
eukprot:TRINITY_DN75831_c0_g1_i1.p1 TRINITY_DN75831_c0_g1~~TRINITY_DN75831_c0_g1_i1.p1  ORF type:complete len:375 (-),score=42.78 TRINITY_DN75831_c0_g1_i1:52-1176(-)